MKRKIIYDILAALAIAIGITLLLTSGVKGQDTVRKHPEKGTATIVIKSDHNGNKCGIDTTITLNGPASEEALRKYLKELGMKFNFGDDFEDFNFNFEMPDLDSLGLDSLAQHVIRIQKNIPGHGNFNRDFDRDYDFDIEVPPVPPLPPDPGNYYYRHRDFPKQFRYELRNNDWGGTLNELLGTIPLENVKSYKIIEKKGGKRIVIDLK